MRISIQATPKMIRTVCLAFVCVAFVSVGARSAVAQNATAKDTQADEEGEAAEEEKSRPTLDLGSFKINDLRPTRNETAKLTFSIHLAFSKGITENQVEQLEQWKHRLRDQVITAIRVTYIKDFQEPNLTQVRRKILIRVNRLFKQKIAEDVLLTEYMFRTN